MDNSFFAYLQRLEIMAFFSGYTLLYAIAILLAGNRPLRNSLKSKISSLLPFGYALVGTLYLGLKLKNLYPDYSIENIKVTIQNGWLVTWGLLSILFWIPALAKKKFLSLIHSLVFFSFLIKDILLQLSSSITDNSTLRNDMNVFSNSLLLNLGALAFIALLSFLFQHKKRRLRY